MALIYVRSTDGSDADDGSTWALAKATLTGALAIAVGGDTIYVSQSHAETTAADVTLTSAGTAGSWIKIICVNDGAEPPTTLATTATISTTGANSDILFNGFAYCYGIGFSAGTTSNPTIVWTSTTPNFWEMEGCSFRLNTTGTGASIQIGANSTNIDDAGVRWINCSVRFGSANQIISIRAPFEWLSSPTAINSAGSLPTVLFSGPGGIASTTNIRGVDFQALGSGNALVNTAVAGAGNYYFQNCRLGSSATMTSGAIAGPGGVVVLAINVDSGDTNYKLYQQNYAGTITEELTIVRTNGATDGTTPISRKMATTSNSLFVRPLISLPIFYWNESISSVTISVPVITDNVTLTDAEAWIEVEYLGNNGFSLSSVSSDRATNVLTTPANQTTDSNSSWTTTGLTTPIKQILSTTFTPAEKGIIAVRVCLAKVNTTMYFDPLVLASSGRQYQTALGFINEKVNTSAQGNIVTIGNTGTTKITS